MDRFFTGAGVLVRLYVASNYLDVVKDFDVHVQMGERCMATKSPTATVYPMSTRRSGVAGNIIMRYHTLHSTTYERIPTSEHRVWCSKLYL